MLNGVVGCSVSVRILEFLLQRFSNEETYNKQRTLNVRVGF